MEFKPVDKIPHYECGLWPQTHDRWKKEGMPLDELYFEWMSGEPYFGIAPRPYVPLSILPKPGFERMVFEEDKTYLTYRGIWGEKRKSYKIDMSMDQFLEFPVKEKKDFLEMKRRFNPCSLIRYPLGWNDLVNMYKMRDTPLCLLGNGQFGLYSMLRRWMGTENLSCAFYYDSSLIHEMLDFLADFILQLTEKACKEVEIDYFNFFEDFCFKNGPLFSPETFREFFFPRYKIIIEELKRRGIKYFLLDTDGDARAFIPLFIELGITCIWPLEVQAGMDINQLRKEYKKDIAFIGGIDKRALAKTEADIEKELRRTIVPELLKEGGYIPTLDHSVPSDVPYRNFLYYNELKLKLLNGK